MARKIKLQADDAAPQHRCQTCGKSFATGRDFEQHACVKVLQSMSLDELMRLYNARKGG